MKLGHVGLFVSDFDRALAFYQAAFDVVVTDCTRDERRSIVFLTSESADHHQIVLISGRPVGADPTYIVQQISFQLADLAEVQRAYHRVVKAGAQELWPVTHGTAWCVYFKDPEGNRLEVFADSPWYVTQPHVTPVDYTRPLDDIYAETEAICKRDASFQWMSDWRANTQNALAQALASRLRSAPWDAHEQPG